MNCPRCEADDVAELHRAGPAEAPLWRVFHCAVCAFTWRDSEPGSAIDPAQRDRFFQLDREKLKKIPVHMPPP